MLDIDNQYEHRAYNQRYNYNPNKSLNEKKKKKNFDWNGKRIQPSPARIFRQAKSAITGNRESCELIKTF